MKPLTVENLLEREAQLLGRPVEYRNAWSNVWQDEKGEEHTLITLVYRAAPLHVAGFVTCETRWVTAVDNILGAGGVASSVMEKEDQ